MIKKERTLKEFTHKVIATKRFDQALAWPYAYRSAK
jgi:hypothetical protein